MKKNIISKFFKKFLSKFSTKKTIDEEEPSVKTINPGAGLEPIDNTDPQNPVYPPKK